MIEINLLPSGTTRRPAAARRPGAGASLPSLGADPRVAGMALAGVLLLVLGGFWFWTSGQKRDALAADIDRAVQDSVRLERTIAVMKTLDTRRDTIDRKMDVIRQVDTRRYVWPHLLDEVSRAVPPYMWLTKVAVVDDEAAPAPAPRPAAAAKDDAAATDSAFAPAPRPAGPGFTVEGNAGSMQSLTRFMKNLESSPMITRVVLVTSQQDDATGRALLKFTLEARWEDPDPAFVQTVPLLTTR